MAKKENQKHQSSKELVRYSREELEEFRKIINKKLKQAYEDLEELNSSLRSIIEADHSLEYIETGSELSEKEELDIMIARTERFIRDLKRALVRIDEGTYGICKVTGKLIPKERLRAVPHTELSIEAKMQQYHKPLDE